MFCDFCHACHELRIFNMLNNFVHEWTLTHSVRAFWAISSGINANAHASLPCFIEVKMADVGENLDSSSSEDEEVLLSLLMLRRRRRRLRAANQKTWVKSWVSRRQTQGACANIVRELNYEDPEKFRQYHRLDRTSFEEILALISPSWQGRMRVRIDSWADSSKRAHTVSQCSLVHEIIQHVEYSELMARVTKIAEHDTAHLRKQLTPTATSDAQLSW